jgi:hypothetical protein
MVMVMEYKKHVEARVDKREQLNFIYIMTSLLVNTLRKLLEKHGKDRPLFYGETGSCQVRWGHEH